MRIFISHGIDKGVPAEVAFLDELIEKLGVPPANHHIVVDRRRIQPGDDWNDVLDDMLADCHGAVLLLGPRALDRPWVWKEATLLSFRRARDPAFPFYLVRLPGVAVQDLDTHPVMNSLRLTATQAFPPNTLPGEIASWVLSRVATVSPAGLTPLDQVTNALVAHLGSADGPSLQSICDRLLPGDVEWAAGDERRRQYARALAGGIVRGRLAVIGGLTRLLGELRLAGVPVHHLAGIRELAASLWVDSEVSAKLAALIGRPPEAKRFVAGLNATRLPYSSRMVARRAVLPDITEFVFQVAGGNSDDRERELVDAIRRAFREGNEDMVETDEEVDELLAVQPAPTVYVLPQPVPDDDLLLSLRKRFPAVTFVAHTGAQLPGDDRLPTTVLPLEPGLDPEMETVHLADYLGSRRVR